MINTMKKIAVWLMCFLCGSTIGIAQDFNYGEALQKSLFFYEVQQSGELPDWNRVSWKGDSGLDHGQDVGVDLTGGWYDAGDHVKFNFPMAASVTMLAWGGVEYKDAYEKSGQMEILKRNLKFTLDYMLKCHTAPNELYIQVGNGREDHKQWVAAEAMTARIPQRPSYKVDASDGGTDIAAEFAAAFSASSILFKDSDPAYSATLIEHAEQLYDFADTYRQEYSKSYEDVAEFYNSWSGFQDELVWGAAWLYRATNKQSYLTKAESEFDKILADGGGRPYAFSHSWDDKSYGSYVLLAQLTGKQEYITAAQNHFDFWTVGHNGEQVTYTDGGQAWLVQWGSLRYANTTSFLALVFSDKIDIPANLKTRYHNFAKGQIDYALGDNPLNRSFMCGFGNNPPFDPHHRTAHGGYENDGNGLPVVQSHILYGAMVGGPKTPDDRFEDDRNEFLANEVATDYNAGLTGALVRLYDEYGGNPLTNFPVEEVPTRDELRSLAKFNSNNATSYTVSIRFQNRTAWPARNTNKVSMRYFFDISEAIAAGGSIDDFEIARGFSQGSSSISVEEWDVANGVYYIDISLVGDDIWPAGRSEHRREVQINIKVNGGFPFDDSNDWSAETVASGSDHEVSENIPVYDNGVLVFGQEPDGNGGGNRRPRAILTTNTLRGDAPLTVQFDASGSSDPDGDSLSYALTYGNGASDTGDTNSYTYTEVGVYTAILTVSDGNGGTDTEEVTITVTAPGTGGGDCAFGAPMSTALPNINTTYENMFVIGDGGPQMDNFDKFTINWSLTNNGLYGFAFNLIDGNPAFYLDLKENATHTFDNAEPSISISGSGISGLDGAYDVTMDQGNFVMVSQISGFTIYFSESSVAPTCGTSLGVNDFNRLGITLSPNPANTSFNITGDQLTGAVINVVSITGAILRSQTVTSTTRHTMNISDLAAGLYLVQIQTKSGKIGTGKLLIL